MLALLRDAFRGARSRHNGLASLAFQQLAYYKDTSKHCTEPRAALHAGAILREAGLLRYSSLAPTRSCSDTSEPAPPAGGPQTSTMPSAAKRSREAQDDKPAPKRQRGAATSKASTRRALRAALSRYARVGQTALAAVQRAEVLSRRIEAQTREVEVALAGMMPMGAGGPTGFCPRAGRHGGPHESKKTLGLVPTAGAGRFSFEAR